MTIRGRHRLAATLVLAAMGNACGGGGEVNSIARPRVPETPRTVAQSSGPPAAPITTTARPVTPSSGDRISPPKVVDRGIDHVAIARSLLLYGRWLAWHHPDPALVERAYQPESPPGRVVSSAVTRLRRIGSRIVEVDREPLDFAVISRTANAVSFRLTEHLAHRELVDARGRVVAHDAARTEHYVISIMRFASDAPWRLNLVEKQPRKVEVQL